MIRIHGPCLALLLCGAGAAQAQQYPTYNYNYGYGSYYPGYSQTPRYYSPYPYGQYGYSQYGQYGSSQYGQYPQYGGYYGAQASPYSYSPRYGTSPYYGASSPGSNSTYYPTQRTAPSTTIVAPSTTVPYYSSEAALAQDPAPVATEPVGPDVPAGPEPGPAPGAGSGGRPTLWQALFGDTPPPISAEARGLPFARPCKDCFWISAEYLGAFMTPMRLGSPLVTTGSINDPHPGALGQPSTAVLYGNNNVDFNLFSGVGLEAGVFLDEHNHFSLEWRGFLYAPNTQTFNAGGDATGNPLIARPVFATDQGGERIFINSFPGQFVGAIGIVSKSELGGTEFNARYHDYCYGNVHWDLLGGLRYLRLAESLNINETVNGINGNTTPFEGNAYPTYTDHDGFNTTNQFFGAQIGGRLAWENNWFCLGAFAKLGLGATIEHVDIAGATTFISPTMMQRAAGGVLALPSNIGTNTRSVFGIVPEMGLNLGVNVTDHVRVNLGYSFLGWNKVVRPGMAYDHDVNTALAPTGNFGGANVIGAVAPQFRFNDEFFWVSSFNVGIEFHY